jgi:hypothetical protein
MIDIAYSDTFPGLLYFVSGDTNCDFYVSVIFIRSGT